MIVKLFTKSYSLPCFRFLVDKLSILLTIILSLWGMLEVINLFDYYIFIYFVTIFLVYLVTILKLFYFFRNKGKLVFIIFLSIYNHNIQLQQ